MRGCIAISRDGLGDLWMFESPLHAGRDPIYQFGDPLIFGADQITKQIAISRLPALMKRLGAELLEQEIARSLKETEGMAFQVRIDAVNVYAKQMWQILCQNASETPEDPVEIVKLIREDRILAQKEARTMEKTDSTTAKTTATKPDGKAPAEKKSRKLSGHDPKSTIHFGSDKEGKKYGPTNNPKREGSASADRFALYKEGMTIEEALTAGVRSVDIGWDVSKGFITIKKVA